MRYCFLRQLLNGSDFLLLYRLTDIPYKVTNAFLFTLALYFMTNLRREAGAYFFFLLTSFLMTLCMSSVFRTIGAGSRTLSQALAPAAVFILALVISTGL